MVKIERVTRNRQSLGISNILKKCARWDPKITWMAAILVVYTQRAFFLLGTRDTIRSKYLFVCFSKHFLNGGLISEKRVVLKFCFSFDKNSSVKFLMLRYSLYLRQLIKILHCEKRTCMSIFPEWTEISSMWNCAWRLRPD